MKRRTILAAIGLMALMGVGCGSVFTDDLRSEAGCWVEIYEDVNFIQDRPWTRLQGPSEIRSLAEVAGQDWNDKITSMRVGPDAIVQVFEHDRFRGEIREYSYGRFIDDLSDDRMNDRVSSIRIRCR